MKIAIRMDDIAPGMDWEKFDRFRALCTRYNVKPLIGVVPDNRDPSLNVCPPRADFFDVVKTLRAEGWSIAMHGCHHVYTSKSGGLFPLNHLSEFAGLSYEKQSELIRRGRQVLTANGIATDIFMAPAHSYDRNTIRALSRPDHGRLWKAALSLGRHDVLPDLVPQEGLSPRRRGDHDARRAREHDVGQ